ncbi:hypothetical protein BGZ57DRAFT_646070 [Hyaloscypha finlandica]|nr:hypothetical protein BGZ57DRAFT_646070 [Hyaloscypha finlandica]
MPRSLADSLKAFFGPGPPIRGYGYLVMVRRLYQLLAIGSRDSMHTRHREYMRSLSETEQRVLHLLEEWWDGWYKDDTLTRFTKGTLIAYAFFELYEYYDTQGEVNGFEHLLVEEDDKSLYQTVKTQILETHDGEFYGYLAWRIRRERLAGNRVFDDPVLTECTLYNGQLFQLAKAELLLDNCPGDARSSLRRRVSPVAACQRIANECVGRGLRLIGPADGDEGTMIELGGRQLRVSIDGAPLRDPRQNDARGLRHCWWNPGATVNNCPWLTERLDMMRDRYGSKGDRVGMEAPNWRRWLCGCPWSTKSPVTSNPYDEDDYEEDDLMDPETDLRDLFWTQQQLDLKGPPYYLWSIKEKKTVKVADFDVLPQYAVISHTWGRWRTPGEDVIMEGVPWTVPANSRFDVATLPDMIEQALFAEDYAWIDLFCIPQDRNDAEQQRICCRELTRQMQIFKNANTAVAWIFDVEDWRPTAAALAYLAIVFHNNSTGKDTTDLMPLYEMVLAAAAEHATDRCGLMDGDVYADSGIEGHASANGWFSSLWTLQESLIRPDMLLLNRNWQPLVVWQISITLDTIASLVLLRDTMFNQSSTPSQERRADLLESSRRLPPGPREIYALFSTTGMVQLANPSQLSALILAGKRFCKHSRSQAIMSVTGATLWFCNGDFHQFSHPESPDDMIFGLYEPAFINEVLQLVGGSFFMCENEVTTLEVPAPSPVPSEGNSINVRRVSAICGSMLPFSPGSAGRYCLIEPKRRSLVDHPSVRGWRCGIGRNLLTGFNSGDVFLPTAVIVAANCEWEAEPLESVMGGPSSSTSNTVTTQPTQRAKRRVSPRDHPLKGTVQGGAPTSTDDPGQPVKLDDIDIDEWVARFNLDTFAVCVMSSPTEVVGVLLQRPGFGHGPLIKTGMFEMEDKEGVQLPEACHLNWTVL